MSPKEHEQLARSLQELLALAVSNEGRPEASNAEETEERLAQMFEPCFAASELSLPASTFATLQARLAASRGPGPRSVVAPTNGAVAPGWLRNALRQEIRLDGIRRRFEAMPATRRLALVLLAGALFAAVGYASYVALSGGSLPLCQ